MTNFRLVTNETNCRQHFKVHSKMKNKELRKTLWEKEKLIVTSNFSFSHNVFHSYISLVRKMRYCVVMGWRKICHKLALTIREHGYKRKYCGEITFQEKEKILWQTEKHHLKKKIINRQSLYWGKRKCYLGANLLACQMCSKVVYDITQTEWMQFFSKDIKGLTNKEPKLLLYFNKTIRKQRNEYEVT